MRSLDRGGPLLAAASLLLLLVSSVSCRQSGSGPRAVPNASASQSLASPVSRDVDRLGRNIRLPRRPVSVVWQVTARGSGGGDRGVPGPTDYTLTAVITFRSQDIKAIVAQAARRPGNTALITPPPWFPAHARKYLALRNGYWARIGKTSQVFLVLYTM